MFDLKIVEDELKKFNMELIAQLSLTKTNIPLNIYGQTLLHLFSYLGNEEVVKTLLEDGATIDLTDEFGNTALHYAAMSGQTKVGSLLLDRKPKLVDTVTLNGDTALHYSCLSDHKDFTKLLLNHQAEVQIVNKDHLSALHYAIALDRAEEVQMLLNKGVEIAELDDNDYSVLHVASAVGNIDTTNAIIEYKNGKVLVNLKDQALHWAPIHFAKLAKNYEIIDLLKKNGAIDTPPIFSIAGLKLLLDNIKTTMCDPEEIVNEITVGIGIASLTYGANKLIGLNQYGFMTQLVAYGVSTVIIKSAPKEMSLPLADVYEYYTKQYCSDVIIDKITHLKQIASLKHAEKFLYFNARDYLALGVECQTSEDISLTTFNDFGLDWSICSVAGHTNDVIEEL